MVEKFDPSGKSLGQYNQGPSGPFSGLTELIGTLGKNFVLPAAGMYFGMSGLNGLLGGATGSVAGGAGAMGGEGGLGAALAESTGTAANAASGMGGWSGLGDVSGLGQYGSSPAWNGLGDVSGLGEYGTSAATSSPSLLSQIGSKLSGSGLLTPGNLLKLGGLLGGIVGGKALAPKSGGTEQTYPALPYQSYGPPPFVPKFGQVRPQNQLGGLLRGS
jgi:hypothetical protein